MKQQQPRSILFFWQNEWESTTYRNLRLALNITEYRIETTKNICEQLYKSHVVLTADEPTD